MAQHIVADAACAFAEGLNAGGVAAAFKHFPGLGRARANTDLQRVRVNATEAQLRADLEPYRHCAAQDRLTMVASATYPKLGISSPAVLNRRAYDLLPAPRPQQPDERNLNDSTEVSSVACRPPLGNGAWCV